MWGSYRKLQDIRWDLPTQGQRPRRIFTCENETQDKPNWQTIGEGNTGEDGVVIIDNSAKINPAIWTFLMYSWKGFVVSLSSTVRELVTALQPIIFIRRFGFGRIMGVPNSSPGSRTCVLEWVIKCDPSVLELIFLDREKDKTHKCKSPHWPLGSDEWPALRNSQP